MVKLVVILHLNNHQNLIAEILGLSQKKSHFTSFLSTEAVNANFLHTMTIYIENGAHGEILNFSVK